MRNSALSAEIRIRLGAEFVPCEVRFPFIPCRVVETLADKGGKPTRAPDAEQP
jgi:hypothetical protein